jgi:hypothetical protein
MRKEGDRLIIEPTPPKSLLVRIGYAGNAGHRFFTISEPASPIQWISDAYATFSRATNSAGVTAAGRCQGRAIKKAISACRGWTQQERSGSLLLANAPSTKRKQEASLTRNPR